MNKEALKELRERVEKCAGPDDTLARDPLQAYGPSGWYASIFHEGRHYTQCGEFKVGVTARTHAYRLTGALAILSALLFALESHHA